MSNQPPEGTLTDGLGQTAQSQPPEVDPRYRIEREIGRGAMGCVFLAFDQKLQRQVAIKVLLGGLNDPQAIRRFEQEARAAGALHHANVVAIHDIASAGGRPYIVAEYLEGSTLRARLAEGGVSPEEALDWGTQIARGLVAAHEHGVVHRDLKPENLFLTRDGVVKILDFGIAKLTGAAPGESTATGSILGTAGYMSPEQVRGQPATVRSDLFSLGAVLYELASGQHAFRKATALETAYAVVNSDPPPLPENVPPALASAVHTCLQKDPEDRFASARELLGALEGARANAAPARVGRGRGKRRWLWPTLVVTAAVPVLVVGYGRLSGPSSSPVAIGVDESKSLEAHRRYFQGKECVDRSPAPSKECVDELKKAVAADPTYALAWYEIAINELWMGVPEEKLKESMANAVKNLHRVPEPEQLKIRAFEAQLYGREDDAASLYRKAAESAADDRVFLMEAADFFLTRNEADLALPFLRSSVNLSGGDNRANLYLAMALANAGRTGELRALEKRLTDGPQTRNTLRALVYARANLGAGTRALEAARRAVEIETEPEAKAEAKLLLRQAQVQFDDPGIEEQLFADCSESYFLTVYLTVHGRLREAAAVLERGERPGCPPLTAERRSMREQNLFFLRSAPSLLTLSGDAKRMAPFVAPAQKINPTIAASLAANFAYVGDLLRAKELAAPLYPGSPRRLLYEAVVAWRTGDLEGARSTLRALAARNPFSSPPPMIPAAFLYGEVLAELQQDAAAIEALEPVGTTYSWIADQWAWTYPRSLLIAARCHERLGQREKAEQAVDRLLALWSRADPELPLLLEARALKRRVSR